MSMLEDATKFKHLLFNRIYASRKDEREIIDNFHKLYYESSKFGKTFTNTWFLGVQTLKNPLDMWLYQEIIYGTKPDVIIETGTWAGGSALYLATICDAVGRGKIISIDIEKKDYPKHARITYVNGSSTDDNTLAAVRKMIPDGSKVMVILDSDHSAKHVLNELNLYSPMVSGGCYLVVEDTDIHGHPVPTSMEEEGPMEALDRFMQGNSSFKIDEEFGGKLLMSFNPRGYLKKVK